MINDIIINDIFKDLDIKETDIPKILNMLGFKDIDNFTKEILNMKPANISLEDYLRFYNYMVKAALVA